MPTITRPTGTMRPTPVRSVSRPAIGMAIIAPRPCGASSRPVSIGDSPRTVCRYSGSSSMPPNTAMITSTSVPEAAANTRLANRRTSISASRRAQRVAHEQQPASRCPRAPVRARARSRSRRPSWSPPGRRSAPPGRATAARGRVQSSLCSCCETSRGRIRYEAISAAMPIGTLMKKIQRQENDVDEPAAEDRAEDRAEQHRHADDRHDAAHALRAGRAREDRHAGRHDHAAAEALKDAEARSASRPTRPGPTASSPRGTSRSRSCTGAWCRSGRPPSR